MGLVSLVMSHVDLFKRRKNANGLKGGLTILTAGERDKKIIRSPSKPVVLIDTSSKSHNMKEKSTIEDITFLC